MQPIRVVHMSSHHSDSDIRIFHKECRTLADAGYDVTYVVPTAFDRVAGGVNIKSVPVPASRRERFLVTPWRVFRTAFPISADVYHFHDPELMIPALLLKVLGKRVVYDVHEDLPRQILSKSWLPRLLRKPVAALAELLELIVSRTVDRIVAATPHIAKRFPYGKTHVVQNYPLLGELAPAGEKPVEERPYEFIYVGGITGIRGIGECIDAIELLNRRVPATLVLVGSFESKTFQEELESKSGWRYVDYRGQQSREEVARLLSQARCGLVLFHPVPNHVNAQPNKLFEYMSAELPIIASDFHYWRQVFSSVRCGLLADPQDPISIAGAMEEILAFPEAAVQMGRNGSEAVMREYNWEREARTLRGLYSKLLKPETPAAGRS